MRTFAKAAALIFCLISFSSCGVTNDKKVIKIVDVKPQPSVTENVYNDINPITIIAKSKTIISSKEKEEIIKDLDNKLDDLFKSIEN